MIEYILALIVGGSLFAIYIGYCFIREGIKDDLAYPLSQCDVNMAEECMGEH